MSRSCLAVLLVVLSLAGVLLFDARKHSPQPPPVAHAPGSPGRGASEEDALAATFSLVAYDPDRKEWGAGVASKYLGVGGVVPFARAGAGAVATQSFVNITLGTKGIELLESGKSAEETLKELKASDKGIERRQLGIVDRKGEAVTFTGKRCFAWAGGKTGRYYACQGNILKGEGVIDAMVKAYEANPQWPLAWRLHAALEAGEKAGGDTRGKQSAAVLVVREKGGPNGFGDRAIDLRVDDHESPVQELARILAKAIRKPAS
jgi:uncharacterized Ntn-hydrolase superfamily protein